MIVQTKAQSLDGLSQWKNKKKEYLLMEVRMHKNSVRLSTKNGKSNIFAILLISSMVTTSGCMSVDYNPDPYAFDNPLTIDAPKGLAMSEYDLNYFKIDCKNKKAQVEFLQSQKRTIVDIQKSIGNMLFNGFQQPLTKRRNWIINQKLIDIRNYCHKKL